MRSWRWYSKVAFALLVAGSAYFGWSTLWTDSGIWRSLLSVAVALSPFAIAIVIWTLNDSSKRAFEDYLRRELKYWYLICSIKGFYTESLEARLQEQFVLQLSSCWMYCPDDVIHKLYAFMDAVQRDGGTSDAMKSSAEAELMAAIRKDSYRTMRRGKTALTATDFRHLSVPLKPSDR